MTVFKLQWIGTGRQFDLTVSESYTPTMAKEVQQFANQSGIRVMGVMT